ncbi:PREDICTED: trace amine-associated receptor 8c-like isoform X3 [Acropora digitifera]|uniref:trace amine-associated receptor 8c-like isoform X3 n=1 Tax=Acropora digitifera TaxID=70779 RepID=UPI00077AC9E5|nr:PREDICTED: trace amine-associated receptor 8c-like isoform X3 [Acropora digitifera]
MANHPEPENAISSFPMLSASECFAWLTVFGMEAVAIVTLNALTIIVYLKERSLHRRSMYLVIHLAIVDMFVGASVIIESWKLGNICDFWMIHRNPFSLLIFALYRAFPTASAINLGAISLERTHATFRPFQHCLIKKKIFGATIAIVWITTGLISTSFFLVNVLHSQALHIFDISWFSFFLFCNLIIVISYSSIAVKLVSGTQPHHHGATNRERVLTKTLFFVTVVSLLLVLPYIISKTLENMSLPTYKMISRGTYFRLNNFLLFLCYANSLVNPVLYAFRIPEFKKALFSVFHRRSQPAQVFPLN